MKRPLNRSYLNGRVRPWNMKHRLSDLMHVLHRSVELTKLNWTLFKLLSRQDFNAVGNQFATSFASDFPEHG